MKKINIIFLYLIVVSGLIACSAPVKRSKEELPVQNKHDDSLSASKDRTSKIYCLAISEYLKASFHKHSFSPDTLFIGKLPEDPELNLPEAIEKIPVRLITIETALEKMKQIKTWSNVNIAGWLHEHSAEFIIVTFLDGGKPQHNCHVYLKEHPENNKFELDSLSFEYAYKKN